METRRKSLSLRFFNKLRLNPESLAGKVWRYRKEKTDKALAKGKLLKGMATHYRNLLKEIDLDKEWDSVAKDANEWNPLMKRTWESPLL